MSDEATGHEAAPTDRPSAMRRRRLTRSIVLVALAVGVLDQVTKYLAEHVLVAGEPTRWFVGELLGWKLIYNPGAALSIGSGATWVLTLLAAAVVVVIARTSRRIGSLAWALTFGLLLGGAVGNLIDRFFKEPGFGTGHVVDFINYAGFFVGNVADIAIVVAAVLVAVLSLRGVPIDGRAQADPEQGS